MSRLSESLYEAERARTEYLERLKHHGFELRERIGSGLSGNVWKAWQPRLERLVAVKFCDTGEARRNPDIRARFLREAKLLAKCQHPRIPYVLTSGTVVDPETPYIVMEYVRGVTLREKLDAEGKLEPQHAIQAILHVLDALACAHQNDVIHRDVKPNNIIATDAGFVLIDFSIGTDNRADGDTALTRTGARLGTPEYAAPEQLDDAAHVTAAADVYSAGVVLCEILMTVKKFDRQIAEKLLSDAPPELIDVLETATCVSPAERYQDGREFYEALLPFVQSPQAWTKEALALCNNISCWKWEPDWGGSWEPTYFEKSSEQHCPDCGTELLRSCPKCRGPIKKQKHCGQCGYQLLPIPECARCSNELSIMDWDAGSHEDEDLGCESCREPEPIAPFDEDDIPF